MARPDGLTIQGKIAGYKQPGDAVLLELFDADKASVFSVDIAGNVTQAGASVVGGVIADDITVATSKKIQFRDTGIFINSPADGKVQISADGAGADDITLSGGVTITGLLTLSALLSTLNLNRTARTATVAGATTGTIADGTGWVDVTCDDANKIIILPTPTPGTIVLLQVAATGFELRTTSPTTVAINGGTGSAAESAIPANTLVVMICQSATSWKGFQLGSDGTLAKVEVAAP